MDFGAEESNLVTVTELTREGSTGRSGRGGPQRRCRWCQRPLAVRDGPGRPNEFCRQSCRQRDYEARRRATERGLDEGEIIVTRSRLDRLQDHLWILACAIQDVEGDLARSDGPDDYRAALEWLLVATRPLVVDAEG